MLDGELEEALDINQHESDEENVHEKIESRVTWISTEVDELAAHQDRLCEEAPCILFTFGGVGFSGGKRAVSSRKEVEAAADVGFSRLAGIRDATSSSDAGLDVVLVQQTLGKGIRSHLRELAVHEQQCLW